MNSPDNHPKYGKDSFRLCLQGSVADRILLAALVLGIAALWWNIHHHLAQGVPTVYVYHQQQLLASYPLPNDDRVITVDADGELGTSLLEISKHGIRFVSSPCASQYCVLSGQKSYAGSVIACVPNHIMVVLRGLSSNDDKNITFDAISE